MIFTIHDIESCIVQNDINSLEKYVDQIVENMSFEYCEVLIKGLMETKHHGTRNMIALALSDLRCNEAVDKIIELLKSDSTKGSRGTLIYALGPLDYENHIEFIFKLLKDDGLEARCEAFGLIKNACDNIPSEVKQRMIEIAQETVEMYQDVLDVLEQ